MSNTSENRTDSRSGSRGAQRVPPHNLDAEASLLGAMLLSREAVGIAVERGVHPDEFYKPAHRHIFDAIRSLNTAGEPVDPITVADELRRHQLLEGIGGLEELLALQNATPAVSSAERYAKIVRDTARLRRLISAAGDIAEIGYGEPDDVERALDEAESRIFDISESNVGDSSERLDILIKKAFDQLEDRANNNDVMTGVPTGYVDLDKVLLGLQPGTLNIVGARPAMGKSAFALGIAVHAAQHLNKPVLFFSLEMSNTELTQRILSAEAQVDSDRLRTGRLEDADWTKITKSIHRLEIPLYIDDTSRITVMQIRQKLRRVNAADGPPAMVVIDYLQLMGGGDTESRQLEVAEISRGLKLLAREFKIPVVALSQLSRGIEQRQDRRPVLSDLRESGALEQDADVVMFLYREETANAEASLNDRGTAEVLVQKHRSGPTGNLSLIFNKAYTQFVDDPE